MEVPRDQLPAEANPQVGDQLVVGTASGEQFPVVIAAVTEETVTLDANHPLAGQDLTFDLTLVEIVGQTGSGSGLVGLDGKPIGGASGGSGLILP